MKKLFFLFVLCGVSLNSFASESSANRESKTWGFDFGLMSLEHRTAAQSIRANYFLNSNNIVSFSVSNLAKISTTTETSSGGTVTSSEESSRNWGTAYNLDFKTFTTNSFYLRVGLYHKRQVLEDSFLFGIIRSDNLTTYTTAGVDFRIGNQWQWDNFTLGCDWVGLTKDIAVFDVDGPGVADPHGVKGTLLSFYIGASF